MLTKRQVEFLVPAFLICVLAAPFAIVGLLDRRAPLSPPRIDREAASSTFALRASTFAEASVDRSVDKREAAYSIVIHHTPLPSEVRGIYWTAVTATSSRRDELLESMLASGLNTVVIDVKMDNGELAFDVGGMDTNRSGDRFVFTRARLVELLGKLFDAGIYRIARVAVMRDSAFATAHPELALRSSDGDLWVDSIGSVWVDPAAPEVADSAIALGRALYAAGFDEIQFDYVRFPSDGAVGEIVYPVYDSAESKAVVMQRFFRRVGGAMQAQGIPVSFDLFGMTFWSMEDYDIGQRLIDALSYADWVSPMVYPSHYPDGFEGYANPAEHPYEIVKQSLDEGLRLIQGVYAGSDEELVARFRPWLQDFDIGAVYTTERIEEQIRATRDVGASGWMLWNARNVYEPASYLP